MSMLKIDVVTNWVKCRKRTISSLRHSAEVLRSSHQRNAQAEHKSATASLVADVVSFAGIYLLPLSGGASLVLCGLSSLAGLGSYVHKRDANKEDESIKQKVDKDVEQAIEEDKSASAKLNEILQHFSDLEYKLEAMRIGDLLISLEETSVSNLKISSTEIESSQLTYQLRKNESSIYIPNVGISTQVANLKAAMQSAKRVIVTKEFFRGTRTIREVVSTAKSVNQISQTAKSLSTAKQAAVLSLQASQSVTKSTTAFASISRGAEEVRKTVGVFSSAVKSSRIATKFVTATGQAASATKTVTKAVNAGTAISTATIEAGTTIQMVKNIREASNTVKTVTQVATDTDKAIRTTCITTNATRVSKVWKPATKVAPLSKVGLVFSACVIPLDLYNLGVAFDQLNMSHQDVKQIETTANDLEKVMENILIEVEHFKELHLQLYRVYENQRIELIYEYLEIMHKKLRFPLPVRRFCSQNTERYKCNKYDKAEKLVSTHKCFFFVLLSFTLFIYILVCYFQ